MATDIASTVESVMSEHRDLVGDANDGSREAAELLYGKVINTHEGDVSPSKVVTLVRENLDRTVAERAADALAETDDGPNEYTPNVSFDETEQYVTVDVTPHPDNEFAYELTRDMIDGLHNTGVELSRMKCHSSEDGSYRLWFDER